MKKTSGSAAKPAASRACLAIAPDDRALKPVSSVFVLGESLKISFEAFILHFHEHLRGDKFDLLPWTKDLIAALEALVYPPPGSGKRRLCVNMPPRFGKTMLLEYFVAWAFAVNPGCRFIWTSYSADPALTASRDIMNLLGIPSYTRLFPRSALSRYNSAAPSWYTRGGGEFHAVSLDGSVTGLGAGARAESRSGFGGCMIIDDPLNARDADSVTAKRGVIDHFQRVLFSRRNSASVPFILAAQRLATDDLPGWLRDNEKDLWNFLSVAAYDEQTGQSVWPEVISTDELCRMRDRSPRVFYSQYQQKPQPSGGVVFHSDWWQYWKYGENGEEPPFDRLIICADTAMKTGERNDYTVLGCFGRLADNSIYMIDMVRGKFEAPELIAVFKEFYNKWAVNRDSSVAAADEVYIEDKASGTGLIQSIQREGIPIIPMRPNKDKYSRALDAIPAIASGRFKLPNGENDRISSQVIREAAEFTADGSHAHDDIIDVICYGIDKMDNSCLCF